VLLEAISFGLPAISFNCPSGPMDIINNENGFLIEDGNRDLFKNKLIELINSDELWIKVLVLINQHSNGMTKR
jgi:glycosyltransferase involved in cell wall biosynthesis